MDGTLYLRQLKAGRDFGRGDPVATAMDNFIYLIGDRDTRECLVVDPAWDIDGVLSVVAEDGFTLVGALVTHWHPDHVGGPMMGHDVEGLASLLERVSVPVHAHKADAPFIRMMTGLTDELVLHDSADVVTAGKVEVTCLHTPGHTEGSLCFHCGEALIAGDTLFLRGCGRTDLPGGDTEALFRSLSHLKSLPGSTVLYPGHDYGAVPHAPMEQVVVGNPMLQASDLRSFLALRGG